MFDSSDASAFTWAQIDGAFSTEGPTPPLKPAFGEEDPVIDRQSAFANDPFQPRLGYRNLQGYAMSEADRGRKGLAPTIRTIREAGTSMLPPVWWSVSTSG